MTWLMRRLTPGGFLFLMLNEVRLATRAARQRRGGNLVWSLLITVYTAIGFWLAVDLVEIPIHASSQGLNIVLAVCVLAMSFMTTQAMLRSQDTLYLSGDLDLLLTAPLPPRRVLLAKLCGIVANIMFVFAAFTLPVALPVALLGHPGLFGIPLLLLALALLSACLGLAITLAIVRVPARGPRGRSRRSSAPFRCRRLPGLAIPLAGPGPPIRRRCRAPLADEPRLWQPWPRLPARPRGLRRPAGDGGGARRCDAGLRRRRDPARPRLPYLLPECTRAAHPQPGAGEGRHLARHFSAGAFVDDVRQGVVRLLRPRSAARLHHRAPG